MKKLRCLFICKKRVDSYGVSFGLLNSATFIVKTLLEKNIESELVSVVDANCIDKEIVRYKPTHVFIEALWVTADKFKELLRLHKDVEFIVRIHSKTPFFSGEGIAIPWLKEYQEIQKHFSNFNISANSPEFTKELIKVLKIGGIYLPNIYFPKMSDCEEKKRKDIHIACFGAIRPLKNQLIQAFAAIIFANAQKKKLFFHINGNRQEDKTGAVLKNLKALFKNSPHELVEHNWACHEKFIEMVREMDLGMQVSYSESFNIVTADFVSNDIPIVVSPDITWMPEDTQVDPNSSELMAKKLAEAWKNTSHFTKESKKALNKYNKQSKKIWLDYLKKFQ